MKVMGIKHIPELVKNHWHRCSSIFTLLKALDQPFPVSPVFSHLGNYTPLFTSCRPPKGLASLSDIPLPHPRLSLSLSLSQSLPLQATQIHNLQIPPIPHPAKRPLRFRRDRLCNHNPTRTMPRQSLHLHNPTTQPNTQVSPRAAMYHEESMTHFMQQGIPGIP